MDVLGDLDLHPSKTNLFGHNGFCICAHKFLMNKANLLCICVFVKLCFCVCLFLCACVFVYLCFVYLCFVYLYSQSPYEQDQSLRPPQSCPLDWIPPQG